MQSLPFKLKIKTYQYVSGIKKLHSHCSMMVDDTPTWIIHHPHYTKKISNQIITVIL